MRNMNDKCKRDFIFTEDAADAILKLINTDYTGIINLGEMIRSKLLRVKLKNFLERYKIS